MATVVAGGGSYLNSTIETGNRNKRKFRAEPPQADPSTLRSAPQSEFPNHDLFSAERSGELAYHHHHAGICEMCRTHSVAQQAGLELDGFQDIDWSCITESQLEEILLTNLDTVFETAIKMIISHGYTEEVATNAVLKSGFCYGYKDTVSTIVENALAFLKSGQELDSSPTGNASKHLRHLEKLVLADMIRVLKDVRPFFSTGDAMWCLLMCDANILDACAMDDNSSDVVENDSSASKSQSESGSIFRNTTSIAPEIKDQRHKKLLDILPSPRNIQQSETSKVAVIPSLELGKSSSSNENGMISTPEELKESMISLSNHIEESLVSQSSQDEKSVSSIKVHVNSSKKEFLVRQNSIHFEKSYHALGSKAVIRACKQSGLGNLIFDRKHNPISGSASINLTSSLNIAEVPRVENSLSDAKLNLSIAHGHSPSPTCSDKEATSQSLKPTTNTELTLSLPSGSSNSLSITPECNSDTPKYSSRAVSHSCMTCSNCVPEDKKDEMLLLLVPLMHELQAQLQDWTDWAQQKVMQAARRLSKDKAELQSLRREKEEVARLQKERHALVDNTKKKLAEMELAISKASVQVERANAAAHRLEYENTQLRLGMEAAKMRAAESAANCQEASRREIKTLKMFQTCEKQQLLFQEELATEKHQLFQLQQQLEQTEDLRDQSLARLKQEEKLKNEALAVAQAERKEREQIETSTKSVENALRLEAENDLRRCKNEICRLEQQIAQLQLVKDSSNIAHLQWGADKSYASRLSHGQKNIKTYMLSTIIDLQESETDELQREWECVMCLSEERSVVFLPCAHQVLCVKCNELHEKEGVKDCPSCRTPIHRRVLIRPLA
ncbi:putative E3 ubiquitin-protein ligase RF298 [Zingiber officinale]|uniref:RING-type domain-containing protein n=1 Tax=Zingiber officinale TaxID=94328 RepID=A0A8J5HZU8_ZINOF|nr:putative E3 ubiquitin-protein ligase RF298 [Zingiber officinale]KAG6537357.1 hypothetical protein ZIOFF_002446 [Zingiber officinale]